MQALHQLAEVAWGDRIIGRSLRAELAPQAL